METHPLAPPGDAGLDPLRLAVRQLDAALIALAAERTRVCLRIGELKRRHGDPVRNPTIERVVVESARRAAGAHGCDGDFAEALVRLLIEHSVAEQTRARAQPRGGLRSLHDVLPAGP